MVWVVPFSSALIMMASSKDLMMYNMFAKQSAVRFAIIWILFPRLKWFLMIWMA